LTLDDYNTSLLDQSSISFVEYDPDHYRLKLQSLQQDKSKLKSLLKKAKDVISSTSQKLRLQEDQLSFLKLQNSQLTAQLQKLTKNLRTDQVKQMLARVKVGD
jgi:chromosome segregation ATPase